MTYEERVNTSAKSYADSYNSYMDLPVEHKTERDFQYEGRKEVARQADAIRWYARFLIGVGVEDHLRQNGYIPEKEEE